MKEREHGVQNIRDKVHMITNTKKKTFGGNVEKRNREVTSRYQNNQNRVAV